MNFSNYSYDELKHFGEKNQDLYLNAQPFPSGFFNE